jgi:hypothetical protein
VGQENIRPKSIVREMFEEFRSFADYIKGYELQRAEGVLLRYLSSAYKVLAQTVPDSAKNETVREMEVYLSSMLKQVDSSLMQEWERMKNPNYQSAAETKEVRPPGAEEADQDITRDIKSFTASIRTQIFMFLRSALTDEFEQALALLSTLTDSEGESWTAEKLRQRFDAYHAEHKYIRLDPEARNARHTYVIPSEDKKTWRVQQILVDPDGHNDWILDFEIDLSASREKKEPVLQLKRIGGVI